ncbi:MAG: hypothetical protein MUF31_15805 [Akkermansiaceae bacterium]|nr:hypothetical protein [Akkermansiaceae bacterium]
MPSFPSSAIACALLSVGLCPVARAEFFRLPSSGDLREDYRSQWSAVAGGHGAQISQNSFSQALPTTDPAKVLFIFAADSSATLWNSPGRSQSGVLLENSGPGAISIYPDSPIQACGVTIESTHAGPTTWTLKGYRGNGSYISGVSRTVADGRVPTFLGFLDPDAETQILAVISSTGQFTISNVSLQLRRVVNPDLDALPVAAQETVVLEPMPTYLHQGFVNPQAEEGSLNAVADEIPNVHDLMAWFPSLRAGDVLAFERVGSSVSSSGGNNPAIGVISSTAELLDGRQFRRVPGALEAGTDIQTPPISGPNGLLTPRNLQQDFIIGARSLVFHPAGGRYLFLSRAEPNPAATPVSVRISHMPRDVWQDWLDQYGFHGSLALSDQDLDGDGLSLLEEFAFGKDPTTADASERADYAFAPFVSGNADGGGPFRLLFGARIDGPIRYRAESSDDLSHWQPLPDTALVPALVDPAGGRAVMSVPLPATGSRRFGRIIIENLSP